MLTELTSVITTKKTIFIPKTTMLGQLHDEALRARLVVQKVHVAPLVFALLKSEAIAAMRHCPCFIADPAIQKFQVYGIEIISDAEVPHG